MRRREFIGLLSGAVVFPLGAHAQQRASPAIGFLSSRSPAESSHLVAAVQKGLREGADGKSENIAVEYRWAEGRFE